MKGCEANSVERAAGVLEDGMRLVTCADEK